MDQYDKGGYDDDELGYDQGEASDELAGLDWDSINNQRAIELWEASRPVLIVQTENSEPF